MQRMTAMSALILLMSCELSDPGQQAASLQADQADQPAVGVLEQRLAGAQRVLVATVERVSAAMGQNEYGDLLIISTVTLQIEERLRGDATTTASFELEGGTVGDLTLAVSDLPTLAPGDRGLFALRRTAAGSWVPNGRSLGILPLAPTLDLQRLRRAEEASR